MSLKYDIRLPDFIHAYLSSTEGSRSPQKLHLVAAIAATTTSLGRRVFINDTPHLFSNDYYLIVGAPGTGKSQAIKTMMRYTKLTQYRNFAPDSATLPKFLEVMKGFQSSSHVRSKQSAFTLEAASLSYDAEILIGSDELGTFLKHGESSREYMTLLIDLYDKEDYYDHQTVNGVSVTVERPLVNILAGTTPSDFHAIFPRGAAEGGLMSRFLIASVFSEQEKKFESPKPDPQLVDLVVRELVRMLHMKGEIRFSKEGYELAKTIHEQPSLNKDGALQHFYARRDLRRKKMAMAFAAMRGSFEISADDVKIAHTIICYFEMHLPRVLGEYGTATSSVVAEKVMQALTLAEKPMIARQLFAVVSTDVNGMIDLGRALNKLKEAGKIQKIDDGFLPIRAQAHYKVDSYVDWHLLKNIVPDDELCNLLLMKPFAT
jgi:hypothetical protein